jgi:hypothetical protein
MREQERFRWSLWPIIVGWLLALWIFWHGVSDLKILLNGGYPYRGFVFEALTRMPLSLQAAIAIAQIALSLLAIPSFIAFITRRTILTIGSTGITFDRLIGWRRIAWEDIIKLEFFWGDAIFHLRENGKLTNVHFRPWTIGLDSEAFRDLVERHQPRLTPDEDDGQPWGRSSSFNP